MSVDATEIKKGVKIKVKGKTFTVKGSFMSTDGIVVTAKEGSNLFDHSIPLKDIEEVVK